MRCLVAVIVTGWLLLGSLPQADDITLIGHTEPSARESFGAKSALALSVFCDLSTDSPPYTCWDPLTGDRYVCSVGIDPDSGRAYGDCSPIGHGGVAVPPPSQEWCDLHPTAPRCIERDPKEPQCKDGEVVGPDGKCGCPAGEVPGPDGKCTKDSGGCGDTQSNTLGALATKAADKQCTTTPTRPASEAPVFRDPCTTGFGGRFLDSFVYLNKGFGGEAFHYIHSGELAFEATVGILIPTALASQAARTGVWGALAQFAARGTTLGTAMHATELAGPYLIGAFGVMEAGFAVAAFSDARDSGMSRNCPPEVLR